MKTFFVLMLIASVASVFYELDDGLRVMGHNHYSQRHDLLAGTYLLSHKQQPEHMSTSLGLTAKELALCDAYVAEAYENSVNDGYRLGSGYSALSLQCVVLAALLLATSTLGIRAARKADSRAARLSNQSLPPTT